MDSNSRKVYWPEHLVGIQSDDHCSNSASLIDGVRFKFNYSDGDSEGELLQKARSASLVLARHARQMALTDTVDKIRKTICQIRRSRSTGYEDLE